MWGANLTDPIVLEMLPHDSVFVGSLKVLYCINLLLSYPLAIYPTNEALSQAIFQSKDVGNWQQRGVRFWLVNI